MKDYSIIRNRAVSAMLAAVLLFSLFLTGCMEDEEETLWTKASAWTEEEGEHWWDHPGQGGTSAGEWSGEGDFEWWSALDDSWSFEDWEPMEEGVWMIFDEETQCVYLYDEEYQQFGAMDIEEEQPYIMDMETGEWILAE